MSSLGVAKPSFQDSGSPSLRGSSNGAGRPTTVRKKERRKLDGQKLLQQKWLLFRGNDKLLAGGVALLTWWSLLSSFSIRDTMSRSLSTVLVVVRR